MDVHDSLRNGVRDLCLRFPDPYWRELDSRRAYPTEFVQVLTEAGLDPRTGRGDFQLRSAKHAAFVKTVSGLWQAGLTPDEQKALMASTRDVDSVTIISNTDYARLLAEARSLPSLGSE